MPKRTDLKKILIIGSGPIVIGQAAEFDYAGTQACIALREEGYEVVLVNSNPATIMTDTTIADKVYMEPLTLEYIAKILRYERPDAIVPGIGIIGLCNIQFIVDKNDNVFIIEVNPRSSRTVPFMSKASGYSLADLATEVILGKSLKANGIRTHVVGKISEGSTEIEESISAGYISYIINTGSYASMGKANDGRVIRRLATEHNCNIFTSLDTVRVLLDVLEETTLCISTIDA